MVARPELAVYIARVATGWSRVEERIGFIIVQLLGADAHVGMKMYRALSGSASQLAVLRAVARDTLTKEMQDRLEGILTHMRGAAKRRNNVVHGQWSISDSHPNELVWVDSGDSLMDHSEFWTGWLSRPEDERYDWIVREYRGRRLPYLLYEEADFEDILSDFQVLLAKMIAFIGDCQKTHEAASDASGLGGG
jgi:hypothetical protein